MTFILTEEEESIRRVARDLARERLPIAELRRLRDTHDAAGFSRDAWRQMAALGLAGMILPERFGGAALGYAALGLVVEEEGRTLAVTPRFASVVLAGALLAREGNEARMASVLPALCTGERLVALAHDEGRAHARHRVTTRATVADGGYRLDGEKVMVLDGHVADALVVVARTAGEANDRDGLTLFLVPVSAPGLTITRTTMIDSRNAARVRFDGVAVRATDVIGQVGRGADLLDPVLDGATAVLSAEMLGGMQEAFERTLAYLKTRKQFGVPIGSFQALKHRAAQMFCEIELTRSIVMHALRAADDGAADLPLLAAAAKARATDAYLLIASEAVQMHGGIGVTDELDVGLFLKRARVCEMTLGDAAYQRERFARVSGY
jgi:alkylation response protein AidB-like acyl-CoA dehydrogenase